MNVRACLAPGHRHLLPSPRSPADGGWKMDGPCTARGFHTNAMAALGSAGIAAVALRRVSRDPPGMRRVLRLLAAHASSAALQDGEDDEALRRLLLAEDPASYDRVRLPRYFVVGSWSHWDFQELRRVDGEVDGEVELCLDVSLEEDGGEFQIVCNQQWDQVLYPRPSSDGRDSVIGGPDDGGHGMNWELHGNVGDLFRLKLHFRIVDDRPQSHRVTWERLQCGQDRSRASDELASVLDALGRQGFEGEGSDWQHALDQLVDMQRWGQLSSRLGDVQSTRSDVLRRCGQAGAWEAALALLEDIWSVNKQSSEPSAFDYKAAAAACAAAGAEEQEAALREELREWGPEVQPAERFCLTPRVYWNRDVKRMGCGARNVLDWHGGEPLPEPPSGGAWLLPASDTVAAEIAERRAELQQVGWRVISCEPQTLQRLDDKVELQALAEELQLQAHMPRRWSRPEDASYPCILKPAAGEFGSGVEIVDSPDAVRRIASCNSEELSKAWLLQEFVAGCYEYSTSLLVWRGEILEVACMRYQYDAEEYVWPRVQELGKELRESEPSEEHLEVMRAFLAGYSGFINFNYKIRKDTGHMCIMEANARIGADLACDVPRARAREMLEALDSIPC